MAFWLDKKLADMSQAEWESLCDGCGKCCLHKLEDEDTGEVVITDVGCRMLDLDTGHCKKYAERRRFVANCAVLTLDKVADFHWLPKSCAYRRVSEGRGLADWHPLVSGTKESVLDAGISVVGRVVDEREAGDFEDHLVEWANE